MPALRDRFELSADRLGLVLMAVSVGAMIGLPTAGWVVQRLGPRVVLTWAGVLACSGVALVGVGPWLPAVIAGFVLFGACTGLWDVAMNVQGAAVERAFGQDLLPWFHAAWGAGAAAGGALGALAAWSPVSPSVHLPLASAAALGVVLVAVRRIPQRQAPQRQAPQRQGPQRQDSARVAWREPRTLALGLLVLGMTCAEGSAYDWLALAVVDDYKAGAGLGATGYALFVSALLGGRIAAPWLVARVGRATAVRSCAVSAIVGIALFVAGSRQDGPAAPALAVLGILAWGYGCSLVFPLAVQAAADDPQRAAARVGVVATIGYLAFLAGPPLLGRLAAEVGVAVALLAVVIPLVPAVWLAAATRPPATRR